MSLKSYDCQRCGNTFRKKRVSTYCSRECYNATRKETIPVVSCLNCQKEFTKRPKDIKRTALNFCSKTCSYKYQTKDNHHSYDATKRGHKCLTCGNIIERPGLKYCSNDCYGKANTGAGSARYNQQLISCANCGLDMLRSPAHIHETNFCGSDCQNTYHSARISGEANPRYKDGVHKDKKQVKLLYEGFTLKLRKYIRVLDKNSCRVCGLTKDQHGMNMHVHHIDYDKTNNTVQNLISLCRYCHGKVHGDEEKWLKILSEQFVI